MTPMIIAQLRAVPAVDLMTAARALGLGRTKAYELARRQQFPCRVPASATPAVSPPQACSTSSVSLPTRRTKALPEGGAEGGERGDASRPHTWAPDGQVPPAVGSSHQAVVRDPIAERGSGPGETARSRSGRLDAHRLRPPQVTLCAEVDRICVSEFRMCILMQRSASPVAISKAVRGT
jgi:hypothetical protein